MLERSPSTDSPPPRSPGSPPPPTMPSTSHPIKEEENKDESEYMLRWSEHNAQLINVFHQLCQRGEFTDVTLATEGEQFKAHKLVLSACSPYFRHLFTVNPCNHPIVFLKDVPDEHMRLLLEYMYRGSISVKQHDLEEILRTASSLKIRGLTTAEPPVEDADDAPRPLIVDEHFPPAESAADKFQHVETLSSHSAHSGKSGSRKCDGRKSSAPKKLRLSEDQDSEVSSPRGGGWPAALMAEAEMERRRVEAEGRAPASPLQTSSGGSHRSPLDNLPVSDGEELDADQPVDFSTGGGGGGKLISSAPRYSILGSYLKTGRSSTTPPEDGGYDTLRRSELAEDLRRAGYGGSSPWLSGLEQLSALRRPASRDSRGDSREERNSSGEEHDKDSKGTPPPPLGSLSETLGIDIAGRLRSHFLANLPTHSYAWLNGMGGASLGGSLGASMGSLGTLGSLANLPRGSRRGSTGSTDKMEKNPLGGVRTGEIGSNGKPSVACEVCGKKLADPSSLYRHRKIHSGDKPHKCPYCPRRFIQRYNMKQHIKTHRIELMADQQPFIEQENHHDISA